MLSEYRHRLSDYQAAIARDLYRCRLGRQARSESAVLLREHSDLFSRTAIEEMRGLWEGAAGSRESERAGLRRLLALAVEGNVAWRVREITDELGRLETGWGAAVPDDELDHLRNERFERMHDAVCSLGYSNYAAMRGELREIDYERLALLAEHLLSKTEEVYRGWISALLAREWTLSLAGASDRDLRRLELLPWGERYLRHDRRGDVYRDLFRELGFRTEQQANLEVIFQVPEGSPGGAECFPIRVPEEVKLFVPVGSGQWGERSFWRAAGAAQSFAWTSSSLPVEFRHVTSWGDRACGLAWEMLFENLLIDPEWLMGAFGYVDDQTFIRSVAALRLIAFRRQAFQAIYDYEFFSRKLGGSAGDRFAELKKSSLLIAGEASEYLRIVSPLLTSVDYLRAGAFEAQLREFFKSTFGSRWWASRKAGDMLIDIWNTGQRHSLEELASLIGLGKLDFDWLAEDLTREA